MAKVYLIPLHKRKDCRKLPENIEVYDGLADLSKIVKSFILIKMLFSKWFWNIPLSVDHPRNMKELFCGIKYLYGSFLIKDFLLMKKSDFSEDGIFYSYWFNHTPLGLCWAKDAETIFKKNPIYTRAHGFDVYERQVQMYFPYRNETLCGITAAFVVSQTGCNYLHNHYKEYKDKIKLSRLGVFPIFEKYVERPKNSDVSFVSCSSLIPLKRVECIFYSINEYCKKNPQLKVEWLHIGGGNDMSNLQSLIRNCATNLFVSLLGMIDNVQLRSIYKEKRFDIFINLSISEGVPVSIMEAISAGIPVIATDVGGNHEIVVNETGRLIPLNFTYEQFEEAIHYILNNMSRYRKTTIDFYNCNFSALENYTKFYRILINE